MIMVSSAICKGSALGVGEPFVAIRFTSHDHGRILNICHTNSGSVITFSNAASSLVITVERLNASRTFSLTLNLNNSYSCNNAFIFISLIVLVPL